MPSPSRVQDAVVCIGRASFTWPDLRSRAGGAPVGDGSEPSSAAQSDPPSESPNWPEPGERRQRRGGEALTTHGGGSSPLPHRRGAEKKKNFYGAAGGGRRPGMRSSAAAGGAGGRSVGGLEASGMGFFGGGFLAEGAGSCSGCPGGSSYGGGAPSTYSGFFSSAPELAGLYAAGGLGSSGASREHSRADVRTTRIIFMSICVALP